MWIVFGVAAIITTILNVIWTIRKKNVQWVFSKDWSALMDVVPVTSKALWGLTILSIFTNGTLCLAKRIN